MNEIANLKSRGVFLLDRVENTTSLIDGLTAQRDRRVKELINLEKRVARLREEEHDGD